MTTKDAIHQRVDELDEDSARLVFVYLDLLARATNAGVGSGSRDIEARPGLSKESKEHHGSLRDFIGILGEGEPTDIETYKDEYIADAVESHFR